MTIGIAATGPWAGAGILAGLRAVEAVGHGAIGGFVSLAVLTADQKLLRAETQNEGTRALFNATPPESILRAPYAALISSGPNRPTPLAQFIAAEPGVGLVTGHRFPQALTDEGRALNELILEGMRSGVGAQASVDALIASHPNFDAGFIALSAKGDFGLGNMPLALRLSHQGGATNHCPETGARIATLHNAIQPSKAIAIVANEVALNEIRQRVATIRNITVAAGLKLSFGVEPEVHIDGNCETTSVVHPNFEAADAENSFGIGDRVKVVQLGRQIGWLGQEPFMVVKNGVIITLDGKSEIQLPVMLGETSEP